MLYSQSPWVTISRLQHHGLPGVKPPHHKKISVAIVDTRDNAPAAVERLTEIRRLENESAEPAK